MKGKVQFFNAKKGYGFINGDDGSNYFVHYSNIDSNGYKKLKKDQIVEFEPASNEKGSIATKVKSA